MRSTLVGRLAGRSRASAVPLTPAANGWRRKVVVSLFENAPAPASGTAVDVDTAPTQKGSRRALAGVTAFTIAIIALLILSLLPANFVIQRPGPVLDTLGTSANAAGDDVPLISITGEKTYPTGGSLDLLTVQVAGNRDHPPSWFEIATAWMSPQQAVLPMDEVFPEGVTTEQRDAENTALMQDSQSEATAAALIALGHDVGEEVIVAAVSEGSAADGVLEPGDIVRSVNGTPVGAVEDIRSAVNAGQGSAVSVAIERDGQARTVSVTPRAGELEGKPTWLLGVEAGYIFDFPIDVTIQIDRVGGPSAGMMFALGIYDKLTPGELNSGERVAGTGTITAQGDVGPIGGIRQKMYGARDAGATVFLAPVENCGEIVGNIPSGITVYAVDDLDDALAVMDALESSDKPPALPTCTSTQTPVAAR